MSGSTVAAAAAPTPRLLRDLCYNIGGQLLPLLLAAVSVPVLIKQIGVDRFGLLTIAWMVVGYFNLFDLGLGRAMTRIVADRLGSGRQAEVPRVVSSGLSMMTALGALAALLVALATPWLIGLLHVPAEFVGQTRNAFVLLAVSVPAVILTTGLRGILEAHHRFRLTNAIRMPMGLWTFGGPLCVLPFTARLDWIVASLVLGRYIATAVHVHFVFRQVGSAALRAWPEQRICRELLTFGGWMTISNVISPLMVYMDRFFIGALLGSSAVAFYTSPYEVVFKLNIVSEGLFGVLFPLMVQRFANDRGASDAMFALGAKLIVACLFPAVLAVVVLAQPFLQLWLGTAFAQRSSLVMQLLAIGIFINGFSKVAFNLIQAHGRADVTAGLHLLELPLYSLALVLLVRRWGIDGAAVAWVLRMLVDAGLLWWMSRKVIGVSAGAIRSGAALGGCACLVLCVFLWIADATVRMLLAVPVLLGAALAFWVLVLGADERTNAAARLRVAVSRGAERLRIRA
ncbi:flippase [Xanthomonas campestris pv. phormiicola]|nr:flippase [Xanthomonas campestris pv. phormiicola]UYC16021.1 flippase [Xanthomonas campestris pv. phormiicola]